MIRGTSRMNRYLSELEAGMKHDQYACIGDRTEAVRHAVAVAES